MSDEPDRRRFLKLATCGLGTAVGIAAAAPAISLVLAPTNHQTVTTPKEAIDIGDAAAAKSWSSWQKIDVIAPEISDGWNTARNVILGAAFVRAGKQGFEAVSGMCPHLGCAVGLEGGGFLCPCHDSKFGANGEKLTGPSQRDLDPLPIAEKAGRLQLTWVRYKLDRSSREPA